MSTCCLRGGPWLAVALGTWLTFGLHAAEPTWLNGITEPITDVTMAFPTLGVVAARPVAEGDPVRKGQVIIELDKRLEELDVERKRLAEGLAQTELNRVKALAEKKALSFTQEDLDRRTAEHDIARVEREVAIETVRRRLILSPVDGYVVQFFKDVGEKCEEQQPVVRVVDIRRCYFVGNIEARAGQALKLGQKLALEIESGDRVMKVEGTIAYLSPVVDPSSGLLKFKAVFDNPDGRIRPGVVGRAQIP